MLKFPNVMDVIQSDATLFGYLSECVLLKPYGLKKYRIFYPRAENMFFKLVEKETAQVLLILRPPNAVNDFDFH